MPTRTPDRVFSFPHPVDEVSARLVATGVVGQAVLYLATRWEFLLVTLAYGFVGRVFTGPTLSPLGRFATEVVRPRLSIDPREVPGPPKRFAQAIGAVLTGCAAAASIGFEAESLAFGLLVALSAAASLEAFIGFCLGCWIFRLLMRTGVVPASTCEACDDLWSRSG